MKFVFGILEDFLNILNLSLSLGLPSFQHLKEKNQKKHREKTENK
jgi:hypothetical protein